MLFAIASAALVEAPNVFVALLTLVLAGFAWTAVISTLNAELQLFLPVWVRARGLAVFMVVFTGSQAVGAVVWGIVAGRGSVEAAFLVAAALVVAGVVAGLFWRVPETGHLDREPAIYWSEPTLGIDPDPDGGPVLVTVQFTVSPEREADFLVAMEDLRGSRLRTGANRWELYRDAEHPDRFIEMFSVPSWEEHLRQHGGRLTASDQEVEETALAFSDPPAQPQHLLPPER